jgi:tRNA(fMet)-specific endonuclease VapC
VKYLLDTDPISILQRQQGPEYLNLSARIAQHAPADLAFSVVSFHEQMLGAHTYISRARGAADLVRGYAMLAGILRDFSAAPVAPFDAPAAALFLSLQSGGLQVATMDLRIASIALSAGLILLTRNLGHFSKVPNLQTDDWTK